MIDAIPAFFLGVLVSPYFFGITLCWLLWLDYAESELWPILAVLIVATSGFLILQVDRMIMLYALAAYIPIGIVWSVYRWLRYCNIQAERVNEKIDSNHRPLTPDQKQNEKNNLAITLAPRKHTSKIVTWILSWPTSVVINLTRDLIDSISTLVKTYLHTVYQSITDKAVNSIDVNKQEKPHDK